MCALETDSDSIAVFVALQKLRYFTVIIGIVEDVGRRKKVFVTYLPQPFHYYLEKTGISGFRLIKLLIEGFLALR